MLSTFHGLETARRGMMTQQNALYVTGHNIANANTPGYSRQRVNFVQTPPYPFASQNRPMIPGQMGTGVEGGTVQRVREQFLDVQYRGENMKFGYWNTRAEALKKMEEIMNEPSENGLAKTLDRFWQSLQDLAVNPSNSGARSVVRERGIAVAETFHYLSDSLTAIQNDMKNELEVTVESINSLAQQLNNLNKQIGEIEPHGYLPNDLYDERDRLLDELSQLVNIRVVPVSSGGNALKIAEGRFTIELMDKTGTQKIGTLVDATYNTVHSLEAVYLDNVKKEGPVTGFKLGTASINQLSLFSENGKLGSLIDSYGYTTDGGSTIVGLYPDMLLNLNAMAEQFAAEINRVHESGWSITEIKRGSKFGTLAGDPVNSFFTFDATKGAASTLQINQTILDSLDNIAASNAHNGLTVSGTFNGTINGLTGTYDRVQLEVEYDASSTSFRYRVMNTTVNPPVQIEPASGWRTAADAASLETQLEGLFGGPLDFKSNFSDLKFGDRWTFEFVKDQPYVGALGDGSNALALAEVKNSVMSLRGSTTTIQNFYEGVIGQMAVNAQEAERLSTNSDVLRQAVDERRMSVSSVSLDEEMTNMIKFQHAYNASARMITLVDEMLDKIINGMGVVGR
ncbi:flagellar hook-associated protein 1 FlgK [Anoxybacillus vitaminiphilus]|uniref:Flagellar hook-associated protein 1 n=1 Tax=Paranoxybacillus vitaminiphilus TaxID=581036 RepID=A0A327YJI3_9BACL|nr:flagellar hook-associated protein FlgK [Anoxybacillus vitaminiphilus]RAK19925.1 flagellar hook-associated protein 1 FlgK [Anoxybacillus vitaminiphilus]